MAHQEGGVPVTRVSGSKEEVLTTACQGGFVR